MAGNTLICLFWLDGGPVRLAFPGVSVSGASLGAVRGPRLSPGDEGPPGLDSATFKKCRPSTERWGPDTWVSDATVSRFAAAWCTEAVTARAVASAAGVAGKALMRE